jgi:hypothetical protein
MGSCVMKPTDINVSGSVYILTQTVLNLAHPELRIASQHCHRSMSWQFVASCINRRTLQLR